MKQCSDGANRNYAMYQSEGLSRLQRYFWRRNFPEHKEKYSKVLKHITKVLISYWKYIAQKEKVPTGSSILDLLLRSVTGKIRRKIKAMLNAKKKEKYHHIIAGNTMPDIRDSGTWRRIRTTPFSGLTVQPGRTPAVLHDIYLVDEEQEEQEAQEAQDIARQRRIRMRLQLNRINAITVNMTTVSRSINQLNNIIDNMTTASRSINRLNNTGHTFHGFERVSTPTEPSYEGAPVFPSSDNNHFTRSSSVQYPILLTTPVWNEPPLLQTIGRAVRAQSHDGSRASRMVIHDNIESTRYLRDHSNTSHDFRVISRIIENCNATSSVAGRNRAITQLAEESILNNFQAVKMKEIMDSTNRSYTTPAEWQELINKAKTESRRELDHLMQNGRHMHIINTLFNRVPRPLPLPDGQQTEPSAVPSQEMRLVPAREIYHRIMRGQRETYHQTMYEQSLQNELNTSNSRNNDQFTTLTEYDSNPRATSQYNEDGTTCQDWLRERRNIVSASNAYDDYSAALINHERMRSYDVFNRGIVYRPKSNFFETLPPERD